MMQEPSGYEYDAWLASACMPAGMMVQLLDRYGSSGSCYRAFTGKDAFLCKTTFFRRITKKTTSPERLCEVF